MMDVFKLITDKYVRQARAYPVVLALLAPSGTYLLFFNDLSWGKFALDCGVFIVLLELCCHGIRSKGTDMQAKLLKRWGGFPSVALLRWRDTGLSEVIKNAYRAKLISKVPGLVWPTRAQERANPAKADQIYERASNWLVQNTRAKEFELLLNENIRYGFHRNLLSIKHLAIFIAACCLFVVSYQLAPHVVGPLPFKEMPHKFMAAFLALSVYIWLFYEVATHRNLKKSARGYARQLLSSLDSL